MILYFTGTGNSRYAAEYMGKLLDDAVICINDYIKKNKLTETFTSSRPFIFITPVYAWRLPRLIADFIRTSQWSGSKKAYFILTCGDGIGNAEKYAKDLCEETKLHFMGCAMVKMPENYIALFKAPEKSEIPKIIRSAHFPLETAADSIKSESTFPPCHPSAAGKLESGLINPLFYKLVISARGFYSTDSCTQCRLCENLCPLNNITFRGNRPVWGKNCTHCMACICRCPAEAIEYKKISVGKDRYFNDLPVE